MGNRYKKAFAISLQILVMCLLADISTAQSTEQRFPTPITQNQISGKINARDIGDARLTTYFFTFDGDQGDIFINIQALNMNGDIDIFETETMRPLSKVRLFADFSADEIVRSIYLRKSEKLLLRIEGRTPNDDPAEFKIQFSGSFVPSKESAVDESAIPKVSKKTESDTEVNSIGTIIAVKPKVIPTPTPRVEIAKVEKPKTPSKTRRKPVEIPKAEKTDIETPTTETPKVVIPKIKKPKVVVTKPKIEKPKVEKPKVEKPAKPKKEKIEAVKPPVADQPEKKLIVVFNDGTTFQKLMSEVLKFSVERETLTIISKTGEIKRYSISDVAKLSIE